MVDSVYYLSYDGLDGPSRELLVSFYFLSVGCFLRVYISVCIGRESSVVLALIFVFGQRGLVG